MNRRSVDCPLCSNHTVNAQDVNTCLTFSAASQKLDILTIPLKSCAAVESELGKLEPIASKQILSSFKMGIYRISSENMRFVFQFQAKQKNIITLVSGLLTLDDARALLDQLKIIILTGELKKIKTDEDMAARQQLALKRTNRLLKPFFTAIRAQITL